jgi:hypothetical protein
MAYADELRVIWSIEFGVIECFERVTNDSLSHKESLWLKSRMNDNRGLKKFTDAMIGFLEDGMRR